MKTTTNEASVCHGLFGVFDILGFKAFCLNNSDRRAAELLSGLEIFDSYLNDEIVKRFARGELISAHLRDKLRWMLFSDTIFIAIQTPPLIEKFEIAEIMLFNVAVAILNRMMFEVGLPLRGVVHKGGFIMTRRCLAGKAVIDSFELAQALKLAACVYTAEAREYLEKVAAKDPQVLEMLRWYWFEHDVPMTTCIKRMTTLRWLVVEWRKDHPGIDDALKFVLDRFSAENKPLDDRAKVKAENTAKLLQCWLNLRITEKSAAAG